MCRPDHRSVGCRGPQHAESADRDDPIFGCSDVDRRQHRNAAGRYNETAGSSRVSDEIVVVTAALVLGRVLQAAIGEIGIGETVAALTIPT